ncbi:twin-arginine translocase subunit TatC [Natronomonas halophila]|uniref:twin-arginine translocase subunit TatC n=1 Tax=Natronomonas halophila TaxID=2747817 RepID=UPI0015B50909|nr:twin-arginine translocase subunit TatC [Natronomonas halophila]QLD85999.1 twin-arginine translocase subunit TatC [Natronomonas halophila]
MSSAVDDDVKRTVAEGRQHLGTLLRGLQKHLQKVFIVFLIGFIGTFTVLRLYVWEILKQDLNAHPDIVVVAITPFEVILLQAKIGLAAGVVFAIPPILYLSRDSLKARGRWPENLPRWKAIGFGIASAALFAGGVAYAYYLFFPLMFAFLASNAVGAGFEPTYSISMWAQFIFLLSMSFGLAAQLPLAMSSLSYSGIVQYETFRDKWKYAVIAIFVFGALFSPPDPFTQIMWAVPLVTLYGISLYISKIVVTTKRSSSSIDIPATARERWNALAGLFLVGVALVYAFYTYGGYELVNSVLAAVNSSYRFLPTGGAYDVPDTTYIGVLGAIYGLIFTAVGLGYFVYDGLEEPTRNQYAVPGGTPGDPAAIDLSQLDEAGIRAAPVAAFARLEEEEALALAEEAMKDDDPERAQAILDRFDNVNPPEGDVSPKEHGMGTGEGGDGAEAGTAEAAEDEEDAGILARRSAGMLDAFSEDEIDEDDVGGYAYDIAFVVDSLTSKAFALVGVFMAVMAAVFFVLYQGGIGELSKQFVSRMPSEFAAEQVSIVTLHPVEALIFMIKVSVIAGAVATLPLVLYYAWPALKERGLARGDRRVLLLWGGTLLFGLTVGSIVGFIYVAPAVISWLAADVLGANMIIAYRISNYGWMIFFLTAGIGILSVIPVSMFLFHRGNIVPYSVMRNRWREFTIAVLAIGAFFSPRGVFTMFLLGIPVIVAYLAGLGVLWAYTLGGRRTFEPAEGAD